MHARLRLSHAYGPPREGVWELRDRNILAGVRRRVRLESAWRPCWMEGGMDFLHGASWVKRSQSLVGRCLGPKIEFGDSPSEYGQIVNCNLDLWLDAE